MSPIEARITQAKPRRVDIIVIDHGHGRKEKVFVYLWPWRREPRRPVQSFIARSRIWKPG